MFFEAQGITPCGTWCHKMFSWNKYVNAMSAFYKGEAPCNLCSQLVNDKECIYNLFLQ